MRTLLPLLILAACGGANRPMPELPPVPAPSTTATLAGPLCEGTACRCRSADGDAGDPGSPAVKRFEFKIGPVDNEMWVGVDGKWLYKSRERATECFYVDLSSPGDHKVEIRAHGDPAFGARVDVHEMKANPFSWYDTFHFGCGAPGACEQSTLREWKASLDKYVRGIQDPCGSTKIKGIVYDTGRMPDASVPADLWIELTLQLYKFTPEKPHGDPSCASKYQ